MNIQQIVKETLIKFQQRDYKRGGVSVAPEMYDAISREVASKISSNPMLADSLPLSKNCEYFNSDECDCTDGYCHYGEKR